MSIQQPSQAWDDGVDLRRYIGVLDHHKWLILALIAMAVAVAGIISYVVLPPTYQSPVIASFPAADGTDGLGMNPKGYEEFAVSLPVIAAAQQKLGSGLTPNQVRAYYDVVSDPSSRLLTVTASAQVADEAQRRASAWVDAFYEQTLAFLREEVASQKAVAEQAVQGLQAALSKAEDALDDFNQETPVSLMEARLSTMEIELVTGESRLRELTLTSIPTDEARLTFLQSGLSEEPEILSGSLEGVTLPEQNAGAGVTSSNVTILNPVYLALSQDLASTRIRHATSQKEAEILDGNLLSMQSQVDRLRNETVALKTERGRLDRSTKEAKARYSPARSELNRLLEIERRLPELARADIVSAPVLPQSPVAPRKVLNVALAGILSLLLGVIIAFALEWYRGAPAAMVSDHREAATAGSTADS